MTPGSYSSHGTHQGSYSFHGTHWGLYSSYVFQNVFCPEGCFVQRDVLSREVFCPGGLSQGVSRPVFVFCPRRFFFLSWEVFCPAGVLSLRVFCPRGSFF